MSEAKPFPADGYHNGAVPASASAPAAPGAPSADAEAPAAGNVAATPVEPAVAARLCWCGAPVNDMGRCTADEDHRICKCGAPPHPGLRRCLKGHPYYGGDLSTTHGLYITKPSAIDVAARADAVQAAGNPWWRFDWQREMFVEMGERLDDLLAAMRGKSRTLSVPNMKVGMQLLREWNQLSTDLEASKPMLPRVSDSEQLARVARVALRHPDAFIAMFIEALASDGQLAPLLRAALDAHDAKPQPEPAAAVPTPQVEGMLPVGVPRLVADEPDEMLL